MKQSAIFTAPRSKGFRLWLLDTARWLRATLTNLLQRYQVWCMQTDKAENPTQL